MVLFYSNLPSNWIALASFDGQDGNRLQLEKTGPNFSSWTHVYVVEKMQNRLGFAFFLLESFDQSFFQSSK